MTDVLDPALKRDLTEAKAALARHGVVIVRALEAELEPALIAAARDALSSSPGRLARLSDPELDKLMGELRSEAGKAARDLKELYVRILAELGTEYVGDIVRTLDGIDRLFRWDRIAKSVEGVNAVLAGRGFGPASMPGPDYVSRSLEVELAQKWPPALDRFRRLAKKAVEILESEERPVAAPAPKGRPRTKKARQRKGLHAVDDFNTR